MQKSSVILIVLMFSPLASGSNEPLDMAFLEWLGETAEVEELGVNIDDLIQLKEDSEQQSGESSQ